VHALPLTLPPMIRSAALSLLCLAAVATPAMAGSEWLRVSEPSRAEMRRAVAEHRVEQSDQIRADEAMAGRRLTPAERAELREQVRSEWASRNDPTQTAESGGPSGSGGPHNTGGWRSFLPWASNSRQ